MKSRTIATLVGALFMAGCAAFPAANAYPSPGSLTPTTNVASRGSVYFVSDTEAWELTQPPDRLRTVILRTVDGGAHWKIWGIAPEPASPVVFTTTDVLLANGTHLLRSSDGTSWTTRTMPGNGGFPTFLPDMRHGWLDTFPSHVPSAPSPSPVTGKGGGGSPPPGKGGGTSTTPANTCNDKGCQPTQVWATADGGATWRLLLQSTFAETVGGMYFFSPTIGLIEQNATILVTNDGGVTWRKQAFSIPGVTSDQPAAELAPTMFDATHGVMPIVSSTGIYLSRTSDGGLTWSQAQRINDCAGCTGLQLMFLDDQHWIDDSQGLNFTSDGGQTWRKVSTTNPGKTTTDVELVTSPASAVIVLAPGLFASETTDWGAHWRAVALPDIYPSYAGLDGQGGWNRA